METCHTRLLLFQCLRCSSWIVHRFQVSTGACQFQAHGRDYDFRWVEEPLGALVFHLVLCTRSDEFLSEARDARLKVSGYPAQYNGLGIFQREQRLLHRLTGESILPTLVLDVSSNDIQKVADTIADWMVKSGGLWSL